MKTSHPDLAGKFMLLDSEWRSKIFHGGLLLLLLPLIGWPISLGYRKSLITSLHQGGTELLPHWHGRHGYFFLEGMKALCVIFGYLAPLYIYLASLLYARGFQPDILTAGAFCFFAIFPIFSTLSFPFALLMARFARSTPLISTWEMACFLIIFSLIIFLIPAAFLQVSQMGKYLSAFRIDRALKLLVLNFRQYCSAWYYSGLMSLLGHFAFPFSPWGVIWCYLGIIFLFNEIIFDPTKSPEGSWYSRIYQSKELAPTNKDRLYCIRSSFGESSWIIDLYGIAVPLPNVLVRFLRLTENSTTQK